MMWYNIKEKLPKIDSTVEFKTKDGFTWYGRLKENNLNLYFEASWTDIKIDLGEVSEWRKH